MAHITLTELRANMAKHLDKVEADRVELVVTRQNHEPVVVMPLAELEGLRETLHLLSTPANAEHLGRLDRGSRCGERYGASTDRTVKLAFTPQAMGGLPLLAGARPAILMRVNELIREASRTPFKGIGKPEPLVGSLKGWWSRRITREHRLVYRVAGTGENQTLEIAACRFHYR